MPLKTEKKMSTATRMVAKASFDASPMPSQMTNSGARMTRGMALSRIMTGSSSSASTGSRAAANPSAMPMVRPMARPASAAVAVAPRWGQSSPPAARSSMTCPTADGGGM